jgi:hypothetical protein
MTLQVALAATFTLTQQTWLITTQFQWIQASQPKEDLGKAKLTVAVAV